MNFKSIEFKSSFFHTFIEIFNRFINERKIILRASLKCRCIHIKYLIINEVGRGSVQVPINISMGNIGTNKSLCHFDYTQMTSMDPATTMQPIIVQFISWDKFRKYTSCHHKTSVSSEWNFLSVPYQRSFEKVRFFHSNTVGNLFSIFFSSIFTKQFTTEVM